MKFFHSSIVKTALTAVTIAVLMSGCLYREAMVQEGNQTSRESVRRVQNAVDQYQNEHGLLPLITPSENTPKYEKIRIDLQQLRNGGYLESLPGIAFENGGSAYFLIQNEEHDPVVKVMDLVTVQHVNDVERLVAKYIERNPGKLPAGEGLGDLPEGLFTLDLKLIGGEQYSLNSVYTGQPLGYLVDEKGRVYVDYAPDLMQTIEKTGITPAPEMDIREMLTEQSDFVPVKSLPYVWEKDRPIPQLD